ncbi:MAG: UDP-3-O-(3-hydroxymyristoyl)glucosamine N-acyltransferase [Sideroxydans sp.]
MPSPSYTLAEIVARLGGIIEGDEQTRIARIATLEKAQPGDIAFLANAKYRKQLESSHASAFIVGHADAGLTAKPRIVAANPYAYFARLSALLNPPQVYAPGVHPTAVIAPGAQVAADAHVGPQVTVGAGANIGPRSVLMAGCRIGEGVEIGADCRLYSNVTVYDGCILGQRVIVHSGAVIGADGFGIAWDDGQWVKIPQIGRVRIGNDVEIGANTTIDRGALDDTVIEEGVKLDNQIQVAHNVRIGAHTAIAGCVGIAGSAVIGRHCRIGGGAIILGHLEIADGTEVSAGTVITRSIEQGSYTGAYPFSDNHAWRRNAAQLRHLDEMAKRIRQLEHDIATLKGSKA